MPITKKMTIIPLVIAVASGGMLAGAFVTLLVIRIIQTFIRLYRNGEMLQLYVFGLTLICMTALLMVAALELVRPPDENKENES